MQLMQMQRILNEYERRAHNLEQERIRTIEPTDHQRALIDQRKQLKEMQDRIAEELLEKQADARAYELTHVVNGFEAEWQKCKQMNAEIDQKIAETENHIHEMVY